MSRQIDPNGLVSLPRMDAGETLALVSSLAAAAKKSKKDLSSNVKKALRELDAAKKLNAANAVAEGPAPVSLVREADHAEDAAWSALYSWLSGFAKLPESVPQYTTASELLAELFPDRLHFTHLPFKSEWTAVETKLKRLDQGLATRVESLGGKAFLENARGAHAAYGRALGTTTGNAPAKASKSKGTGELRRAVEDELRTYVVKVTAIVEKGKPATAKLAAKLLLPLTEWKPKAAHTAPKPPVPPVKTTP